MKINVEELSPRELDSLLRAAERRAQALTKRRPIAVVRAELIAIASSYGYTIEELLEAQPAVVAVRTPTGRRKLGKVPAKYRDPENKRNQWSGRGSMPRWLAEKVKRGQSAADFLIPGLAKPTANHAAVGQRSVYKQG
ncbi:H-NS family nucleoid-associated regulatory protein [Luteimonas sp. WGS1318]|uniref:H-NS histone family protein n=1 Tax=Luteimonas sp. WGS1318 TaxID=3366815 RepID=UPI00372D3B1F